MLTACPTVGDHLWVSRFLLHRVAEEFGTKVSFDPEPIPGGWKAATLLCTFSTKEMRVDGGMKHIEAAIKKLEARHMEHIAVYGQGGDKRLIGHGKTGAVSEFSYGVADRGAAICIPRGCAAAGCGMFEDRRPASNADPYQVTGIIMKTCFGAVTE